MQYSSTAQQTKSWKIIIESNQHTPETFSTKSENYNLHGGFTAGLFACYRIYNLIFWIDWIITFTFYVSLILLFLVASDLLSMFYTRLYCK